MKLFDMQLSMLLYKLLFSYIFSGFKSCACIVEASVMFVVTLLSLLAGWHTR